MGSTTVKAKFSVSFVLAILLKAFGALWSGKILSALNVDIPVGATLDQAKAQLKDAVQHCDPDGGALRVSGTLRGAICKAIDAAGSEAELAAEILAIERAIEKYAPPPG